MARVMLMSRIKDGMHARATWSLACAYKYHVSELSKWNKGFVCLPNVLQVRTDITVWNCCRDMNQAKTRIVWAFSSDGDCLWRLEARVRGGGEGGYVDNFRHLGLSEVVGSISNSQCSQPSLNELSNRPQVGAGLASVSLPPSFVDKEKKTIANFNDIAFATHLK
jgi:hypothetical protein